MKGKDKKLYEVDLYDPVKNYFTEQGYDVYGEVHDCDVVVVKDDELIIIELKLRLNLDLVMQATKRQRLSDQVYVAIPRPTYSFRSQKWRDICYLMRRLEVGLIVISFQKNKEQLQVIHHPVSFDRVKSMQLSKKRRTRLLAEIEGRTGDFNIGGSSQMKIMTAYKETCIHIACCLIHHGPLSAKVLREIGTGDKTSRILIRNYDEWFERIERGVYAISEKGKKDLKDYPEFVEHYMKLV
ncbi:DUF2161 family putative PD-(D/E)XK-type phosphodiesterase [Sporosarcina pasteurii]|uniref:Uncharacterized conserved protein n=1 Tax=Sporosarcina pasteurii TaxID=1474 RepID=A0A380BL69_SPOPA|nr:DUF2161 family putative PD-(D/E)XK-type phosphodiesterase [Sporosarcina pasteurii]MDS9470860.1 DUF2161 family putative PD-(D/E)XK-type phosphodiesterase [Sporosarcina pasteurii]QBQ05473.1 hypothetical protein E2C16_07250 [Sporosarcina pasteurii]SUJ02927.1 Uncharacterized conserved protein [Sporosarcina pasteurii]